MARYHAVRLGLRGFAANLVDGRVRVIASGPADAIEALGAFLAQGPRGGRVDGVDQREISDEIDLPKNFETR
jgi:acylphosphatase